MSKKETSMNKSIVKFFSVGAALLLSACSAATYKEAELKCPTVLIAKDTAEITKIVDGQTLWKAKIKGYKGDCSFSKKKDEMNLNLDVEFDAEFLTDDVDRGFTLPCYVAAPALYPEPVGKQNFYADVVFLDGKDKITARKKGVDFSFPLVNKAGEVVNIDEVYIGIQLDKEQLQYNRDNNSNK